MHEQEPARTYLGRYEICDELGRGGMAAVYRVLDPVSGRFLAAKQLLAQREARLYEEACLRFEREFHTLSDLSHPRIIEVYDYALDAAGPFYTMELLTGGDLLDRSPVAWREACAVFHDVCSSLALLHARRLVHCDISPRNVRCTQDGRAKLIDFGAMVPMGRGMLVAGTPSFTAPEVVARADLDGRTDLFSVGATLYYALTGRVAFAARDFYELIDVWRVKPRPPSQFTPGIPEALDALTMSLLSLDASERPRNAFEVMQRLAAIAELKQRDTLDVSEVYLATPALVGREPLLAALREEYAQALDGQGRAVIVRGRAGLGRSRVLDASAIAAKLRGVCVVRASSSAARGNDFEVARSLCQQVLEAMPDAALCAADAAGVRDALFVAPSQLRDLTQHGDRAQLQSALTRFLLELTQSQALAIALDDVHRCDEPTVAWLAQAAAQSSGRRLLLLLTLLDDESSERSNALEVLCRNARSFELQPLSESDTAALLMSVFGDVPHVHEVAHAVHTLAAGNPRLCMELARHLVDQRKARYLDGNWALPAQLSAADLPQSAETALRTRVAALTQLARELLEAQALASHEAFLREDYAQLSPDTTAAEVDAALSELVAREFLVSDGSVYWLAHRSWSRALTAHLSEAAQRARHAAIAALYGDSLKSAFHYFAAGQLQRGLDLLLAEFKAQGDTVDAFARLHLPAWELANLLERAIAAAQALQRSPREITELQRRLLAFSAAAGDAYYWQAQPALLERLRHDSGLARWEALAHVEDRGARLTQAFTAAFEHYNSTPEAERVYRPDEAIRHLVQLVAVSIAVSFRSYDTQLVASLPGLLEPFAPLSPAVDAIHQNALASRELRCYLQTERARARWFQVYEKLSKLTDAELPFVDVIRRAIASGIANVDVTLGQANVEHFLELIESDPMQTAQAFYLRKVVSLQQGDWAAAESFRKRAEQTSLQSRVRPMFLSTILNELLAHARAADLTGVQQLRDRIAHIASESEYWRAGQLLADAIYQRLCGQLEAASRDFEACIGMSELDPAAPARVPAFWLPAVAGAIETWVERGMYREAEALGTRVLAKCRALEIDVATLDVSRALALAYAKLGDFEQAVALVEQVIARQRQLGATGLMLGASYEARARIAIWARDEAALTEFGALTAREYRRGAGSALGARYERLMDEARAAFPHRIVAIGDTEFGPSGFASTDRQPSAARLASQVLRQATTAQERAAFALSLLCKDRQALAGHLYLVTDRGLTRAASHGALVPDETHAQFALDALRAELDEPELATRFESDVEAVVTRQRPSLGPRGAAQPIPLSCMHDGEIRHVGIALLVIDPKAPAIVVDAQLPGVLAAQLLEAGDVGPCSVADLSENL